MCPVSGAITSSAAGISTASARAWRFGETTLSFSAVMMIVGVYKSA
jgi:hypothetical protein